MRNLIDRLRLDLALLWPLRHDLPRLQQLARHAVPFWVAFGALVLGALFLWPLVVDAVCDVLTPDTLEKRLLGLFNRTSANPWRPWLAGLLWLVYAVAGAALLVRLAAQSLAQLPAGDADATVVNRRGLAGTAPNASGPRYVTGRELGRGAMGVVHEATDTLLHRTVALKTLAPHLAGDPELRERFLREARAVARLNHRNIVAVYDLVDSDGDCRIAMEYVHGPSLAELAGRQPQPLAQALAWGEALADALALAHEQGVIHRDIKPANVLMERASVPRLVDFGLAKIAGGAGETQLGTVMGSPAYMSPEQASGSPVDHRTDIYALGIVLYELLAGRPPFTGESSAVIAGHLAREVPPLADVRPDVPAGVSALVARMLAKAPDDRPATMREVRDALAALRAA